MTTFTEKPVLDWTEEEIDGLHFAYVEWKCGNETFRLHVRRIDKGENAGRWQYNDNVYADMTAALLVAERAAQAIANGVWQSFHDARMRARWGPK